MTDRLHFAWVGAGAVFDPAVHARSDEAVRGLEIRGAEGEAAVAAVTVADPGGGLLSRGLDRYAFISATLAGSVHLLFHGVLREAPRAMGGAAVTLELDCRTGDTDARVRDVLADHRVAPHYDPLFVPPGGEDRPEEVLNGRFARLFIDRTDGRVRLSDNLDGRRTAVFGAHEVAGESVGYTLTRRPLPWVDVSVAAEWEQRGTGTIDAGAVIRRHNGGPIATLSPDDAFAERWPGAGEGIGPDSGYTVRTGRLVEQPPPPDADAGEPLPDQVFGLGGLGERDLSDTVYRSSLFPYANAGVVYFRRRYFRPELWLDWAYSQRRREVVTARLYGDALVPADGTGPPPEPLRFALRDVAAVPEPDPVPPGPADCTSLLAEAAAEADDPPPADPPPGDPPIGDPARASFFLTARGRAAVDHALQVAAVTLAESQRAVRITARVPGLGPEAAAVDCDTTVTVESPRLPGGSASGKVVGYRLVWDADGRGLELTLMGSVGNGSGMGAAGADDAYAVDYWNAGTYAGTAGSVHGTGGGRPVTWHGISDQGPTEGLTNLPNMTADDFVERVCLANQADQQDAYIWNNRTVHTWPPALLAAVPTDVALALRPLRGRDVLENRITAEPTGPFGLRTTVDPTAD